MRKSFEYGEIKIMGRRMKEEYHFEKTVSYSLIELLNDIGYFGWELVGEVKGKIIVKRLIIE